MDGSESVHLFGPIEGLVELKEKNNPGKLNSRIVGLNWYKYRYHLNETDITIITWVQRFPYLSKRISPVDR